VAELSRTHELIVDAVTTLLTSGGHRDEVDSLLYAAMGHTRRRTYGALTDDKNASIQVTEFIRENFDQWRTDVAIGWRKNERAEPSAFEPKTIKDRIRATVRERVRGGFENFMIWASPEEQHLLLSIFEVWQSNG
jgi:hypothetical protein